FVFGVLERDLAEPHARGQQVDVAIVEARDHAAALAVQDARGGADQALDVAVAADRDNPPAPHGNGLGFRLARVNRPDLAILKDEVRLERTRLWIRTRILA